MNVSFFIVYWYLEIFLSMHILVLRKYISVQASYTPLLELAEESSLDDFFFKIIFRSLNIILYNNFH